MMRALLVSLLGLSIGAVQAEGIDANISGESLNFAYQAESINLMQGGADIEAGAFVNQRGDSGVFGKMLAVGQQASQNLPVQFGVGAKAMFADVKDGENISGIGVGGRVGYVVPSRINPIGFIVEGYVAPGVTSFGNVDQIRDVSARVEVEMSGNTTVGYVGFRHLASDYNGVTTELDDNVHVGLKMRF